MRGSNIGSCTLGIGNYYSSKGVALYDAADNGSKYACVHLVSLCNGMTLVFTSESTAAKPMMAFEAKPSFYES
jgi:hypothetical protein